MGSKQSQDYIGNFFDWVYNTREQDMLRTVIVNQKNLNVRLDGFENQLKVVSSKIQQIFKNGERSGLYLEIVGICGGLSAFLIAIALSRYVKIRNQQRNVERVLGDQAAPNGHQYLQNVQNVIIQQNDGRRQRQPKALQVDFKEEQEIGQQNKKESSQQPKKDVQNNIFGIEGNEQSNKYFIIVGWIVAVGVVGIMGWSLYKYNPQIKSACNKIKIGKW